MPVLDLSSIAFKSPTDLDCLYHAVTMLQKKKFGRLEVLIVGWLIGKGGESHGTNEELGRMLNAVPASISIAISHLRQSGIVEQISYDGRKRVLRLNKNALKLAATAH